MEVTKSKPNKTYIIKPYITKTHLNYTTTKESKSKIQNSGGGSSQNNDIKIYRILRWITYAMLKEGKNNPIKIIGTVLYLIFKNDFEKNGIKYSP